MKKVFIVASLFTFAGVVASCNSDKKSDDKKEGGSEACDCVSKIANAKDMADFERVQKECEKVIQNTTKDVAEKCPDFGKAEANMNRIMEEAMAGMDMGDMEMEDMEDMEGDSTETPE